MGIMAVSAACLIKAGAGVNAIFKGAAADTNWDFLINEAEATVNVLCRFNFNDDYAGLDTDTKLILEDVVARLAAIDAIAYDMSGYTSRIEAEDLVNIHRDGALRGLSILRDKKAQDFINAA